MAVCAYQGGKMTSILFVGLLSVFVSAQEFESCYPLPVGATAARWQCSSAQGDVCLTSTPAGPNQPASLVLSYARGDQLIAWFNHAPSWFLCSWSNDPGCKHSVIRQRATRWTGFLRQVERYAQPPMEPHVYRSEFRWDLNTNTGRVRKATQDTRGNHVLNPEEIVFSNCWQVPPLGEIPSGGLDLSGIL